jgi:Fur family peroxide stress response transcriptional regulator
MLDLDKINSYIIIMTKKKVGPEEVLRGQGARVTPQRVAILRAVENTGSHPDADAVYRHVTREYPHISRDTVYRTLSMMEEKKIIGSILFVGNAKRYDPNTSRHHHLVCIRCRKVMDFIEEKFDRLDPPASAVEKFRVLKITVHVEGFCAACQGRKTP